jgi:hypothetical protein
MPPIPNDFPLSAPEPSPFASLSPSVASLLPVYRIHLDANGLPVTTPLIPFSTLTALSAVHLISRLPILITDSGCTGLIMQLSNFPTLAPFFSPQALPRVTLTLPDGSILPVGGPTHLTGTLNFTSSHKSAPVLVYFLPPSSLFHSLFGVSPLIRPHGHAVFNNSSVSFYDSPSAALPFLTGSK